jgi:hypothetical protein
MINSPLFKTLIKLHIVLMGLLSFTIGAGMAHGPGGETHTIST